MKFKLKNRKNYYLVKQFNNCKDITKNMFIVSEYSSYYLLIRVIVVFLPNSDNKGKKRCI